MESVKMFDICHCKGFYKKMKAGRFMFLDEETMTANEMDFSVTDTGIVKKDIESMEKTYYKHVNKNFKGVVVGFTDLVITGYLDAVYEYNDYNGNEKLYASKRAKDIVKCAIVYYANNKKHYVPLEEVKEL